MQASIRRDTSPWRIGLPRAPGGRHARTRAVPPGYLRSRHSRRRNGYPAGTAHLRFLSSHVGAVALVVIDPCVDPPQESDDAAGG